jgi:hypothetical protein
MHKVHAAATPAVHHVASSLQAIHAIAGDALMVAVGLLVVVLLIQGLRRRTTAS